VCIVCATCAFIHSSFFCSTLLSAYIITACVCVWLSSDIEEEPLRQHFSVCGAITNVRVIRDQKTGAGKGFGYVTFEVMYSVDIETDGRFAVSSIVLNSV